ADRSKMSKRSGEAAVAVGDWRRAGYVSEALLSYLALLGFHPGDEREILSREEMLAAFSLERVGKSGAVFDADKLRWVNAHTLHHASGEQLLEWGREFLPQAAAAAPRQRLIALLATIRGNLATLADLSAELAPFFDETPPREAEATAALDSESARVLCAGLAERLRTLGEGKGKTVKPAIQPAGKEIGRKGRELFQPIRAALTGRTHGPELPRIVELLGREAAVRRLENASKGNPR